MSFCLAQTGTGAVGRRDPQVYGPGGSTLVFPQVANGVAEGAALRSAVTLINNTDRQATGRLRFYDDSGASFSLTTSVGSGDTFDFTLGSGDVFRLETDGLGPLRQGWARAESDLELSGSGTFTVTGAGGTFVSEVGIGDSAPASSQMILAEAEGGRFSGYAVCNPDPSRKATLRFELRAMDGAPVAVTQASLGPMAHMAEYVTERFGGTDLTGFTGVLIVSSDLPFSIVTLRTIGDYFTSVPSIPSPLPGQSASDLVFPRLADGVIGDLRYRTTIFVMNNSEEVRTAAVDLFGSDGAPMKVTAGSTTSSRFSVTVPPRGAARLETAGRSEPGLAGWARITADGPLGAAASFTVTEAATSKFVSEVGVSASASSDRHLFAVEDIGGNYTGFALSNPSWTEFEARVRLYAGLADDGRGAPSMQAPLAEKTLVLPALGSIGRYVAELFSEVPEIARNDFRGRLQISSWSLRFGEDVPLPIAGLVLFSRGARFTSAPAAPFRTVPQALSDFDPRVEPLLARMTLEEKIGQMTQAERGSLREGDIETYLLGSVLSGGGSGPPSNTVQAWADMYDGFQLHALNTRLKIPLLYGIDAVHGHGNVRGAVIFPHNIGLGAARNPELAWMAARITASEVRATGINWTFSPVVAVPRDERWGRTYEGFGEDPDLVRILGTAAVRGFQGPTLKDSSSIVACAKHYVGDGGTRWGTGNPIDQGDTQVDEATLRQIHLPGYLGALEADVGTIMVSFSSWNGEKMTGNRYLLTDVLKGELGFEGFLISDWAAIDQLPGGSYREQVKTAINAGIDMGMVPNRHQEFFAALRSLVQAGEVPQSRIDDAVRRILRVKFAAGLFDRSPFADPTFRSRFGSPEHREVAREAVRQSIVLLKNRNRTLPISKSLHRVHVSGSNADNIGHQCGGWTISWQGGSGDVTPGTTVLEAIRKAVSPETQVTYSPLGTGAAGADVAVVVVGERPYAEGPGDDPSLSLSAQDLAAIDSVTRAGMPVVLVLISGRPLILGTALDAADALIAAWLPGTQGEGIADVLFGDYTPSGKLPCSWPGGIGQVPINIGDAEYYPLFPFGFGLSY